MQLLSSKECAFYEILMRKNHVSRKAPAPPAIGRMKVAVRGADIVSEGIAEPARQAVNPIGCALQFQKHAHGCFVQVRFDPRKPERGPVFLISEHGMEAEGAKH